jgi:hypothetical protein
MQRFVIGGLLALVCLGFGPGPVRAQSQGDYMECAACQLILKMVEGSYTDGGKDIVVDASRQCAILPPGDRDACTRFYAGFGPKFIKAVKDRRARGESMEAICSAMGYCR